MKRLPAFNLIGLVLLLSLTAVMTYLSIVYTPMIIRQAGQPELFRDYLLFYGDRAVLVFILIQAGQVVIAAIPGELIQVAGGYVFGAWSGVLFSWTGIILGSMAAFGVTRLLGYPVLKVLMPRARLDRFTFFMNNPRLELVTFLLFLIPGMPKDILTYLAGLTPMRPLSFFIISSLARLPGIIMSSYIGAGLGQQQYVLAAITAGAAGLCLLLGWLYKDRIILRLHGPE